MAKKYLSLDRLTEYDALLKAKIAEGDESTLESAKGYADEKLATLTSGTTTVAKAEEATHAETATTATNATNATKAEEATHAVSADTATNATNAANANHATTADTATNATNAANATKATQDASGNVITDTYETKTAAAAKLLEAKGYTDEKLAGLTSGNTEVAKATEATKSTQDASGNVITDTYETKADATAKLEEVKGYADTAASNAATAVKNDLLNGAGEAYDTLKELGDLIDDNKDALGALEQVATGKADKDHQHTVADITDYVAPVQADWNQNDETALDYVKNRPFYGVLEEVTLLEETTIEPDEEGYCYGFLPFIPFEENAVYIVVVDGESYECTPYYDAEYNEYVIEYDAFMICSVPDDNETYAMHRDSSSHTFAISTKTGDVAKLDKMYLPDSVFAKPDWDENNPGADGFIKNKPCARYLDHGPVLEDFTFEGTEYEGAYTSAVLNRFVEGQSYDVYFDGVLYEGVVYDDGLYYDDDDVYFEIYGEYWTDGDYVADNFEVFTNVEGSHSISIEGPVYYYEQLDEAYLPASITSDWNETNVNKRSYIKNKPFSALKIDEVLFEDRITPEDINVNSELNITFSNAVEYNLDLSHVSSDLLKNLMSNQLRYTVILNGGEYRNLAPTFFYNTEWNQESFAGGIGASMTLSDNDSLVTVNFTEEYPFSIKLNDLDGMYHFYLPRELEGDVIDLRISVFGNVVDKLPDMYQHQADWNELVDTKASFIANKPFGEYLDYKLVPMYEGVSIIEDAGLREDGSSSGQFIDYPYETEDPNYNPVELNKKYTVIINNVRYDNLECFEVYNGENTSGIPTVGSPIYMLGTSAAEYPFTIDAAGFGGIWLYIDTNKLPITEDSKFYLYEYVAETKVKTLDVKYLSEQFQFGNVKELQYTTILEEEFTLSNGGYGFQPGEAILEEGKSYKITLDGNVFEGTALADVPGLAVWVGENAVIIYSSEYGQMVFSGNPNVYPDGVQHHIVVEKLAEVEVFKTIDKKYLPEHLRFGVIQEGIVDITTQKEFIRTMPVSFQNWGYNCYSNQLTSGTGYMNDIDGFDPDKFYRVVWDDVDYICKPIYDDSVESGAVYSLGSRFEDIVAGTAKTPFNIYFKFKGSIMVHTFDTVNGSHNIALYECEGTYQEEIINNIDPKYLPDIDFDTSSLETAITTNTSAISANTSSIQAHTTAIGNLQTAVAEFEEITSAEITALFA